MGTSQESRWRKSSSSGPDGGACVEFADHAAPIAVRDCENPAGPVFPASPAAFTAFVSAAAEDRMGRR